MASPLTSKRVRVKPSIIALLTAIQFSANPVNTGLQARRARSNGRIALNNAIANSGKACIRVLATINSRIGTTRNHTMKDTGINPVLIANGLVGANVRIATVWVEEKCATPLEDVLRNLFSFFLAIIHYGEQQLKAAAERAKGG